MISEIMGRWKDTPVLACEAAMLLANRFDILVHPEAAEKLWQVRQESLTAMEFQRIQLMRAKGEEERRASTKGRPVRVVLVW